MADRARVAARLEALWALARGPAGGADRPAFSPAEADAMRLVAEWAVEAGLAPALDAHGNLWALPAGWDGPLVTSGSHVDTVPDGGRFDGALGTVLGLELAHDLRGGTQGGARPALLVCAAEEAPRFGAGTIGSRLLVGALDEADLDGLRDECGVSAAQARAEYLRALEALPRLTTVPLDRIIAHAEIHVALRSGLRRLGVVERVAAPRRFLVELRGESGHAGEVAMDARRDALAAAAEVVLAVERAAHGEPAETVATTGTLTVEPGAVSIVPGRVRAAVDVRGVDAESLERLEAAIRAAVSDIARRRQVDARIFTVRAGRPDVLDPALAAAALGAARHRGTPAEATWSGSGHDAQHLAKRVPALLLFVPLHGGPGHTPDEGADEQEIVAAALVARDVLDGAGTPAPAA